MIREIIKKIITVKHHDFPLIAEIKTRFQHNQRSFSYKYFRLMVDCLYCHASPGVIEKIIEELENLNLNHQQKKLLNLGGGTGQVARIFEYLGYSVFNIDLEIKDRDLSAKNINFNLNDCRSLPVDTKFDIVLCQEIIEHLENPWKLFRDAKDVLTPNGLLIISTPNINSQISRLRFLLTGYFSWFTPDCFAYHINPLPHWEIKLIGLKTGFRFLKLLGNGDYFFHKINVSEKKIIRDNDGLIFIFQNKPL